MNPRLTSGSTGAREASFLSLFDYGSRARSTGALGGLNLPPLIVPIW
jgi:hypothetical protein